MAESKRQRHSRWRCNCATHIAEASACDSLRWMPCLRQRRLMHCPKHELARRHQLRPSVCFAHPHQAGVWLVRQVLGVLPDSALPLHRLEPPAAAVTPSLRAPLVDRARAAVALQFASLQVLLPRQPPWLLWAAQPAACVAPAPLSLPSPSRCCHPPLLHLLHTCLRLPPCRRLSLAWSHRALPSDRLLPPRR